MECEECTVTTDANTVNRMIPNKTGTVCDVFNALCCLNFLDDIEDTIELFAG